MSYDLQLLRDRMPAPVATPRERAIYLEAQQADRKVQRARNVADLLERGHRARTGTQTALVIDVKA